MRIVLVGAVAFSQACLRAVLDRGGEVVGVITLPSEASQRHSDYVDLHPLCQEWDIPCVGFSNINDTAAVAQLKEWQPDVLFVFGWSQLIKSEVIQLPPMGCIGTHPALLPKNRGRHPLIWALVEGLEESGLTFFYIDEGADSGDILWQHPFPITLADDAASLYRKMTDLAIQGIGEFLPRLIDGTAPRLPQDHSRATYWPKRGRQDGEVHWKKTSLEIYNLVRALTRPYVGAHSFLAGREISIWRTALPEAPLSETDWDQPAGTILPSPAGEVRVRTGDTYLRLLETEPPLDPEKVVAGCFEEEA